MKTLFREAFFMLVLIASVTAFMSQTPKSTNVATKNVEIRTKSSETYTKKGIACPRDCVCSPLTRAKSARCNRLEIGTQMFGSDISDLIIENISSKFPIALTDMIFKKLGLSKVINIKINRSIITTISSTAFDGLEDLFSVNLMENNIERLDVNTFVMNNELYLLSLSGNPLTFSKTSTHFLNSSSLQELDISKCGISSLPMEMFVGMPNLMYINLSHNKLQKLDKGIFSTLDGLEELELSGNYIKSLPSDLFADNGEMATLYIGNNPLTSITGLKIPELLALGLENTGIRVLKNSSFEGMPYLSNLILNSGKISNVEPLAFTKLSELNYLDISNNNITHISDQILKENVYLDVFKMANNTFLKELPAEGFVCNEFEFNIYLFDASGCSIEVISNNTFKTMPALNHLNLARNMIRDIGSSLHHLKSLAELDLSYNNIEILDKDTFAQNQELGKLNLAGNPLVLLSIDLFSNSPNLAWLDLSYCQLYKIWEIPDSLPQNTLSKLRFLNTSHNQLVSVQPEDFKTIKHLDTLDIGDNPLQCNKIFKKLMMWLGDHNVAPIAKDVIISNMDLNAKVSNNTSKWEHLAKTVCANKAPSNSENKDIPDENILKKINGNTEKDINGDYIIDDDFEVKEDDYYEGDDDDDDDNDDDDDEESDDDESVSDSDDNLSNENISIEKLDDEKAKINKEILLNNKTSEEKTIDNIIEIEYNLETEVQNADSSNNPDDKEQTDILNTFDDAEISGVKISDEDYIENVTDELLNRSIILTVAIIAFLVVLLLITLLTMLRYRKSYDRYSGSTITTIQSRMKRDCGLVYQPLSEDLSGPKTPIMKKKNLISNITSVTYPFPNEKSDPQPV